MDKKAEYVRSTVASDDYEPFMIGDKQAGEVHWLAQTNSNGQPTYSGLWRCEPMTFEYEFPGDEIFQVLQGDLLVEIAGCDGIRLKQGDVARFNKGVKSIWTIQSSFRNFFVISNC